MGNITVGRYSNPESVGWAGWIEPEDMSWIVFVDLEHNPKIYLDRDSETGAVL